MNHMKEVLLKNIKYLLNYKLNTSDARYEVLLEKIFYEFLVNMEALYNRSMERKAYYQFLLSRLNKNIQSIIIPAKKFAYHKDGFLELGISLKEKLGAYKEEGISLSEKEKEELLKMTYFSYLLLALKCNDHVIGWKREDVSKINEVLTEVQAIKLTKFSKFYKKEYQAIYPDGTNHEYFIYTKYFTSKNLLAINQVAILETIIGSSRLMDASLKGEIEIFDEFNLRYGYLLSTKEEKSDKKYMLSEMINQYLLSMEEAKTTKEKIEYSIRLNTFLFDCYNYKITTLLSQKKKEELKHLTEEVRDIETYMIYNKDKSLNTRMKHVEILKKIKTKLANVQNQKEDKVEREYTIYSLDKSRKSVVKSSVEPIHLENKYVLLHIIDTKVINNRVLVQADFNVVDYQNLVSKIYSKLYLSLKELKHLYSSKDLGVITKSSEVIRKSIAQRILNPTILDIIKTERHNFLGEFIYDEIEERCIIYKNKSIEEILEKMK